MKSTPEKPARDCAGDIAIVGMSCLFPDANSVEEYWELIRNGHNSIKEIPASHWSIQDYYNPDQTAPDQTYSKTGGFLKPYRFNPLKFGISPKTLEATDSSQLFGMVAAHEAMEDAGYGVNSHFDRDRVSCILGVTGCLELVVPLGARLGGPHIRRALEKTGLEKKEIDQVVCEVSDSYVGWQEASFPGLLGNVVAGRIASRLDLGGTNSVVDAACGSSLAALTMAIMELRTQRSDMVITGGVDTFNDIFMYMCFSKTPALSKTGHAKPFDNSADGTALGEGVGMVILKRLDDAVRDQDNIYATITGIGSSSDGKGKAIYAPNSKGQIKAISRAYEDANIPPEAIGLIEGHGTGTAVGDKIELQSLMAVFSGAEKSSIALGSVKSQIGHTKAAAGVAGLIKATLSLCQKTLPPTIKIDKPVDGVEDSPFYISDLPRPWTSNKKRRAGVSAFGFGGSNFHCVLEEFTGKNSRKELPLNTLIFPVSADTKEGLRTLCDDIEKNPSYEHLIKLSRDLCQKANNNPGAWRLVAILAADSDVKNLIDNISTAIHSNQQPFITDNVVMRCSVENSKVAWCFPGQGAQQVGMYREAATLMPLMRNSFQIFGEDVTNTVFPKSSGQCPEKKQEAETALQKTDKAQAALGAVSVGLVDTLKSFNVFPDLVAGHSFGELSAHYAAETINQEDYRHLTLKRGELMADAASGNSGMVAVIGNKDKILDLVAEFDEDITVANYNGEDQTVVAGNIKSLDEFEKSANTRGLLPFRLKVGAGFHSHFVESAAQPFANTLKKIKLQKPICPILSGETGKTYPQKSHQQIHILAQQLSAPVNWTAVMQSLLEANCDLLLEVGPSQALSGMHNKYLGSKGPQIVSMKSPMGQDQQTLAMVLSQLWALGKPVDWNTWRLPSEPRVTDEKSELRIEITGANYRAEQQEVAATQYQQHNSKKVVEKNSRGKEVVKEEASKTIVPRSTPAIEAITRSIPNRQIYKDNGTARDAHILAGDSILEMQKLQTQTATLHQQFLKTQERGMEIFADLMKRHQDLLQDRPTHAKTASYTTTHYEKAPPPIFQEEVADKIETATATKVKVAPKAAEKASSATASQHTPSVEVDGSKTIAAIKRVISEKTGYPEEILQENMALEGDLGIDSIKRVEIYSALQEVIPETSEVKAEELSSCQTISDIITLIGGNREANLVEQVEPLTDEVGMGAVYEVISQKTGYPKEMLQPEMNMESDLGIDSIKKVEIFSSLQELQIMENMEPDAIAGIQTLDDISKLLQTTSIRPVVRATEKQNTENNLLMGIIAEKTGYPLDILKPTMSLEGDLGIDSIKKVEILSAWQEQNPTLADIDPEKLQSADSIAGLLQLSQQEKTSTLKSTITRDEPLPENINQPKYDEKSPLERILVRPESLSRNNLSENIELGKGAKIWLTDDGGELSQCVAALLNQRGYKTRVVKAKLVEKMKVPKDLDGLILISPESSKAVVQKRFIFDAFRLVRLCASPLRKKGKNGQAMVVTLSRNDGDFGLRGLQSLASAYAGGLAGIAKTILQEWPEVHAKAIDLANSFLSQEMAANKLMETLFHSGLREVGITPDGPTVPGLTKKDFNELEEQVEAEKPFHTDDVVLVTGGARGVTAAVSKALAKEWQPHLVLLGRGAFPETEKDWLAPLQEESEVKKALMKNLNIKLPAELEKAYTKVQNQREMRELFTFLDDSKASYEYHSIDVRERNLLKHLIKKVQKEKGPIRGVIHGAGVISDKPIVDKTDAQFQDVFSTKVDGIANIMSSIDQKELRALVLFSSSSARYGRRGQVDYAAANEVLNKMAQHYKLNLPRCKTISLNWGPWDGGMVTDSLKEIFAKEGIATIPIEAGATHLINELKLPVGREAEVVVLGGTALAMNWQSPERELGETTEEVATLDYSIANIPVLKDHVLQGKAVLPVAMIIEDLCQNSRIAEDEVITGIQYFQVLKGIRLSASEQLRVSIYQGKAQQRGGEKIYPIELSSWQNGRKTLNYRAEIKSAKQLRRDSSQLACERDLYTKSASEIYSRKLLFHGEAFQGINKVLGCSSLGISGIVSRAPAPKEWLKTATTTNWSWDPLMIDSAFQLLVLWGDQNQGYPNLPTAFKSFERYQHAESIGPVEVRLRLTQERAQGLKADIEFIDSQGEIIARMVGYEAIADKVLEQSFKENRLQGTSADVGSRA